MSAAVSAGLLLYRRRGDQVEVLVAHPGGPLWARRDVGAWSLPKGIQGEGEALEAVARREFVEETGFAVPSGEWIPLGMVRLRSGKTVHGWAVLGDAEPSEMRSNLFSMEWPPRSGRRAEFPEIDRVAWLGPDEARRKLNPAQAVFVERLLQELDVK